MKLFKHQEATIKFLDNTPRAYVASTAGTAKTACLVKDVENKLKNNSSMKTLVLAPKSLLHTVWLNEFRMWAPHIKVSVATAPTAKREKAFAASANVYVTNIDALAWLAKKPKSFWKNFETVIIDESTSIANGMSQRGKAALKIAKNFKYRRCLSGTPTNGLLTKLYNQYKFLDDGKLFGESFVKFRNAVTISTQVGPNPNMVAYENKPGMHETIAYMTKDITIRYVLEEVQDMPSVLHYTYTYEPNKKVIAAYKQMKNDLRIQLLDKKKNKLTDVNAVNAAAATTKLLQISSGAVKVSAESDESVLIDTQRYDLVLDLCEQYEHAIVFFNWKHQRQYFMEQAEKRKIKATYIDGTVKLDDRTQRVKDFQDGKYDVIFLQPQSTAHGITLTRANATIWSMPTYLSDYYSQGNNRMIRTGQKKRTTIIHVEAEKLLDNVVYKRLEGKLSDMEALEMAIKDNSL